MDYGEITQRVVAILTQSAEVKRLLAEEPDRNDERLDSAVSLLTSFVSELLRTEVTLSGDASPEEVAEVIAKAWGPVIERAMAAFAFAFMELAEAHDAGRTDVSSVEVLQQWVLQSEEH